MKTETKRATIDRASERNSIDTRTSDFEQRFEEAKKLATDIGNKIPKSAIYWGFGAALLGAAAIGAFMYRNRLSSQNRSTARDLKNTSATEAAPDFAVIRLGRQPRAKMADAKRQPTVHH